MYVDMRYRVCSADQRAGFFVWHGQPNNRPGRHPIYFWRTCLGVGYFVGSLVGRGLVGVRVGGLVGVLVVGGLVGSLVVGTRVGG